MRGGLLSSPSEGDLTGKGDRWGRAAGAEGKMTRAPGREAPGGGDAES